jgi:N-acetylmuramoyl-L-alanine amidase
MCGGRLLLRVVGICVAILASSMNGAIAQNQSQVEHIYHSSAADYTRVIIVLSGETSHQLFMVPADLAQNLPPRIVIDFTPAKRSAKIPLSLPIRDGLLTQIRSGQFSPTTVRIVLDVEQIDDYKAFTLSSPYRLIIDVRGRTQREVTLPIEPPPTPRYRIMLDPGHGGHDPGAIGANRLAEKDVVLALSRRLGRKLATRLPVDILFTRTTDVFIPLEERTARANATKADLFISIHANASTNTALQGIETYYLNNTNDRATIRLAAIENGWFSEPQKRAKETGLSYILSDLIQTGKEEESISLAHHIQEALFSRAKTHYSSVRNLGVKKGPFYVLVGAHMPCVLVEVAFISHRVEGKHLLSPEYQEALAEGLFLGIARFLRSEVMVKNL